MWKTKKVVVILVVFGALGAVTTEFVKLITEIRTDVRIEHAQKTRFIAVVLRS